MYYEDVIPIRKMDDVENRFYQNHYFIEILPKPNFPY
jgi:hypothetical protein